MTKVQRYKVGYYTDEWGMSSNTPCLVPDDSGYAVKFEDYCKLETELAALKAEHEWQPIETNGATNELENHMCNCEWRDIETAPKNIEIFIGSFIDEVFVFGKSVCFYEVGNEFEGEFYRGWFWSIDDVCESVAECPTHWMPLPKPPAMAQGEQG